MEVSARLKGCRISAQKARLVANQIRGKGVEDALNILAVSNKKFSQPLEKLVRSEALTDRPVDEERIAFYTRERQAARFLDALREACDSGAHGAHQAR